MRKFVLLALLAAALAVPSMAAAFAGTLTGVGDIGGTTPFSLGVNVLDGGTGTYFGLENDHSGSCSGDSGTVTINAGVTFNVVCAHFVASSAAATPEAQRCVSHGEVAPTTSLGSPTTV
jgi:hypothetical protein